MKQPLDLDVLAKRSAVQDFDQMMEIAKIDVPEAAQAREVLEATEARLNEIGDDASIPFQEKHRQQDVVMSMGVGAANEIREKSIAKIDEWIDLQKAPILDFKAPADARAIREAWAGFDPVERGLLYADADEQTKAAIATAPKLPTRRGGKIVFEPLMPRDVIEADALRRAPAEVREAIERGEVKRNNINWSVGQVHALLKRRQW